MVREIEIGCVGTRRHLAESKQDASAEGREGRMRGDFRGHGRVDRRRRWRFGFGRSRRKGGAHGGADVALLLALAGLRFLGLLCVRGAVAGYVSPFPLVPFERLASDRQAPPVQFHQIDPSVGYGFAELYTRFQLLRAHVLDRGRCQLRGPGRGCFVRTGRGGVADDCVEDDAGEAMV